MISATDTLCEPLKTAFLRRRNHAPRERTLIEPGLYSYRKNPFSVATVWGIIPKRRFRKARRLKKGASFFRFFFPGVGVVSVFFFFFFPVHVWEGMQLLRVVYWDSQFHTGIFGIWNVFFHWDLICVQAAIKIVLERGRGKDMDR